MRIFKIHPLLKLANSYVIDATQPSNISYAWNFGSLLAFCLIIQIITGVTLAMHYNTSVLDAFNSVEHIMRDVNNGWLIRYLHSNTASAFFFLVYLHIGRGLYYGSYKSPRTLVWTIGTVVLILMMAIAFLGYVLPYGQMSLWGATVITNLMSAIPWVGQDIVEFIWGGFSVNNATLNRFFALHFVLPFVLAALVLMHLIVLHDSAGSGNPLGVTGTSDRLPFAPYYIFKDLITIFIFILALSIFVFFMPNELGDSENYVMANPMQTPPAIVPEWYLLPFYAILRSIPNKLLGVIAMFSAILIILTMSFTDLSRSRGIQFRPLSKITFFIFLANFLILMKLGGKHVESPFIEFGLITTALYFSYFLIIVPGITLIENSLLELASTKNKDSKPSVEVKTILNYSYSLSFMSDLIVLCNKAIFNGICKYVYHFISKYNYVCSLFSINNIIYAFIFIMFILKTILNNTWACDAPRPWGIYFQDSGTPQMEGLVELHDNILFYLVIILFAVMWILVSILRMNKNNGAIIPHRFLGHGTFVELIWTITPAFILILITFPSFKLLFLMDEVSDPAMAVLAEGHQWYWSYQYPDFVDSDYEFIEFDSYLVPESDLDQGALRMLEVDNRLIIPELTHVRFVVTAADVIHSFACPSLGIKCDAYPGRLNQASVMLNREGTFFGQCSEICGILHSSMPIVFESISVDKFVSWLTLSMLPIKIRNKNKLPRNTRGAGFLSGVGATTTITITGILAAMVFGAAGALYAFNHIFQVVQAPVAVGPVIPTPVIPAGVLPTLNATIDNELLAITHNTIHTNGINLYTRVLAVIFTDIYQGRDEFYNGDINLASLRIILVRSVNEIIEQRDNIRQLLSHEILPAGVRIIQDASIGGVINLIIQAIHAIDNNDMAALRAILFGDGSMTSTSLNDWISLLIIETNKALWYILYPQYIMVPLNRSQTNMLAMSLPLDFPTQFTIDYSVGTDQFSIDFDEFHDLIMSFTYTL